MWIQTSTLGIIVQECSRYVQIHFDSAVLHNYVVSRVCCCSLATVSFPSCGVLCVPSSQTVSGNFLPHIQYPWLLSLPLPCYVMNCIYKSSIGNNNSIKHQVSRTMTLALASLPTFNSCYCRSPRSQQSRAPKAKSHK